MAKQYTLKRIKDRLAAEGKFMAYYHGMPWQGKGGYQSVLVAEVKDGRVEIWFDNGASTMTDADQLKDG